MPIFNTDKIISGLADYYEKNIGIIDKDSPKVVLELGVHEGGSLEWIKSKLAPNPDSKVFGIDIKLPNREYSCGIEAMIANQANIQDLQRVISYTGPLDLIIDDASHGFPETKISFEFLWDYITPGGIYAIEDFGAVEAGVDVRVRDYVLSLLDRVACKANASNIKSADISYFQMESVRHLPSNDFYYNCRATAAIFRKMKEE